ncbi:type II toxin-antitoxin system HipA family toxin [Slackia exigua]|uniref:type II toxin-antitoxin system HipA family toxin n=1 Tax=Slackia exigua TaxID=84109 RepID=UPI00210ECE79|nr:type II toxin-antitoxin system HipA family toxin [Slackia exigua]MCQ5090929.1 type II toxin-antitoxin system HipA family toxin [Slackia exigua]
MRERTLHLLVGGDIAGEIRRNSQGKLSFRYSSRYAGPSVSLSMPKGSREYGDATIRPWFLGLLPDDREVRRRIGREAGISPDDTFGLLEEVGLDCPGAVQVCNDDTLEDALSRKGELKPISDGEIRDRIAEAESPSPQWTAPDESWSLGGNQGKVALRKQSGEWFRCTGSAATTHIVKPGIAGMVLEALDEYFCLRLAHACGIPAAQVEYREFAGKGAIVVERFDRAQGGDGEVDRIHQEDFCQALSVPPDRKYGSDGGPIARDCVALLRRAGNAESNVALFVEMLLFNYVVGATDAHAKNYSVLHLANDETVLAPMYDVASALPYIPRLGSPWRSAMSIGGENRIGRLHRSHLVKFAESVSLPAEGCCGLAGEVAQRVLDTEESVFNEEAGVPGMTELRERLEKPLRNNCERLLASLGD